MKHIWAPWRLDYVLGPKEKECIFCCKPKQDRNRDGENLILYRGELNFIILNLYPYNNGHLMVTPYKHTSDITDLTPEEILEMGVLMIKSVEILKERFKPQGFNTGMNLGSIAGAGIEEHIHMHVVPRWSGDTNFMPVIGDTRVLPQFIGDTYNALAERFAGL
ncbi:MAG: hydrolase [bacterium]|nr:MAG: hydrolase [bacterium]